MPPNTSRRRLAAGAIAAGAALALLGGPAAASTRSCSVPACKSALEAYGNLRFSGPNYSGSAIVKVNATIYHSLTPGDAASVEDLRYSVGGYTSWNTGTAQRTYSMTMTTAVEFQDTAGIQVSGNGWESVPSARPAAPAAGQSHHVRWVNGNTLYYAMEFTDGDADGLHDTAKGGSTPVQPDSARYVTAPAASSVTGDGAALMRFRIRGDLRLTFTADGSIVDLAVEDEIHT